ncbi:MAG: hypothetical protein KGH71_04790 [Candidatus Micrarchaeota archaeon]|nr:hypothetical protein [Candidatus Micrarchaeota archaeon]
MEHETKEVNTEHTHHEHAHNEHVEHQGYHHKSDEKTALYVVIAAFVIGLVLIAMTLNQGNYLYAGVVAGALVVAVMAYYKNYIAATIFATLVIIVITIAYRIMLLHFFGFYEPDGFYHFSVIRAAVLHGFAVPTHLGISGWPNSTLISEPIGLYWVTLIPYFFLQFFGISYYDVIRLIPVLFAIFDLVGTYFLIREFNKDKVFGLLGMLFVGLSMGDAARTSATVYRGDGFVTLFVILGLLFMIRTLKAQGRNKILAYALMTGFLLSLGNIVWNGASFGIAIYIFALVMILLYSFLKGDVLAIVKSRYLLLALAFWYVLANLYNALNLIGGQNEAFTGIYFLVLFALLAVGTELAIYLLKNKEKFAVYVSSVGKRLVTFMIFMVASFALIYFLAPQIVYSIFAASGFQTTVAFAASIEELQAPSPDFLFASFGATMFMAPMSILLYFSTYYPSSIDLIWIGVLALSAIYFFMDFEGVDGKKFLGGIARIRFRVSEALLVFIAYYAVTAYLQMHAVRFNSLLSIPLAIFTAYTVYWMLLWLKNFNKISFVLGLALVAVLIAYIMIIDTGYSVTLIQADNINPTFISALGWMHNNTAPNSVVLTLWPDGSLVEGVANRTSVTDSVGSQNRSKADPFARWVFDSSSDGHFLTTNINGYPDYLMVRYTWLLETSGIYTEAEFNASNYNQTVVSRIIAQFNKTNPSQLTAAQTAYVNSQIQQLYGYNLFDQFRERVNATMQNYSFYSSAQGFEARISIRPENGTQSVSSFLIVNNQYVSPFK